jgi:hypothetical protein
MNFDKCPVCGEKGPFEEGDVCQGCFWEMDALASAAPDKCFDGPNYLPLNSAKARWDAGLRNHSDLTGCPWDHRCDSCPNDGLEDRAKPGYRQVYPEKGEKE